MKIDLGKIVSSRWYYGSADPDETQGIEEDVYINILENKIWIKLQDENNTIRWQEIIHNIPVLTPDEAIENETLSDMKFLFLYSDVAENYIKEIENEIEYIINPELQKWYKNILVGYDEATNNDIYANVYFIEENSEENLLIQEINKLHYKINGTKENQSLNLIIDNILNVELSSINELKNYNYANLFAIVNLQDNGIASGLIFNFEDLWNINSWKNNNNFVLIPKEIKLYNNKYKLREYTT